MKFTITGKIPYGRTIIKFSKEVNAPTQKAAVDLIYSHFGSTRGVRRNQIKIEDVKSGK